MSLAPEEDRQEYADMLHDQLIDEYFHLCDMADEVERSGADPDESDEIYRQAHEIWEQLSDADKAWIYKYNQDY